MKKEFITWNFSSSIILVFHKLEYKRQLPKTLHVNGSLQVVNEINVGGNATTAGSAGTSGQILTSQGAGLPFMADSEYNKRKCQ